MPVVEGYNINSINDAVKCLNILNNGIKKQQTEETRIIDCLKAGKFKPYFNIGDEAVLKFNATKICSDLNIFNFTSEEEDRLYQQKIQIYKIIDYQFLYYDTFKYKCTTKDGDNVNIDYYKLIPYTSKWWRGLREDCYDEDFVRLKNLLPQLRSTVDELKDSKYAINDWCLKNLTTYKVNDTVLYKEIEYTVQSVQIYQVMEDTRNYTENRNIASIKFAYNIENNNLTHGKFLTDVEEINLSLVHRT
jgi:hypothetical protein